MRMCSATARVGSSPAAAASGRNPNSTRRRCSPHAATTAPPSRSTRGRNGGIRPTRLLNLALEIGCLFSIDTDSHAPGQLEFLGYGAQRALDAGVPAERIVNTWSAEKLLEWTSN